MKRRQFLGSLLALPATGTLAGTTLSDPSRTTSTDSRASAIRTTSIDSPVARFLSMRHLHTEERLGLTYRIGDDYRPDALSRFDHLLRDFRTGEQTRMDPELYDLLHALKQRLGVSEGQFEIIGGYRSPKTNAILRNKSSGVAKKSLHMTGQAIDLRLSGVPTQDLWQEARAMGRGGAGYYPGSDFVHLDTGRVRYWTG